MANNLTAVIGADTTGFQKAIDSAKVTLKNYSKEAKNSSNQIKANTEITSQQVQAYNKVVKSMERATQGTKSAQQAQKALQKQIASLRNQWSELSDTAKSSDFGKSISESIKAAESESARLSETIKNTKSQIGELGKSATQSSTMVDSLGASFTKTFQEFASGSINESIKKLQQVKEALKAAQASTTEAGVAMEGAGAAAGSMNPYILAATLAAGALATAFKSIFSVTTEFSQAIKEFGVQTGMSKDNLDMIASSVIQLGAKYGESSKEIIEAATKIAGIAPEIKTNAAALTEVTDAAKLLAQTGFMSVDDAGQTLIDTCRTMGVSIKDLNQVVNALVGASISGSASVQYISKAMSSCNASATTVGISFSGLAAIISTVAPRFKDAQQAGELLNDAFQALASQTNNEFNPAIVGLDNALDNLADAQLDDVKLANIVGKSNVAMIKTLIEERNSIKELTGVVIGSTAAQDAMRAKQTDLQKATAQFKEAWNGMLQALANTTVFKKIREAIEAIVTSLKTGLEWVTKWINKFGSSKSSVEETISTIEEADEALQSTGEKARKTAEDIEFFNNAASDNLEAVVQLRELEEEIKRVQQAYSQLSAEEKAAASGQDMLNKLEELRAKAQGVREEMQKTQDEGITPLGENTSGLDAFTAALGLGADALTFFSSVMAKVTGDEESLRKAITTIMVVQSAANLVTKVSNTLNTQSAIILKVRALQESAAALAIRIKTAAETKGTAATKAATAAQAALNIVTKANPYVLLGTAILAAGAALYAFCSKSKEAEAAAKRQKEAAEKAAEAWKKYKNDLSSAGADLLSTYTKLRTEWVHLKDEHSKTQWIKDNKSEFDKLGVSIDNASEAENFLVTNTQKVVSAFMLRAKAAAYAARSVDQWREYLDKKEELDKKNPQVRAGDENKKSGMHTTQYGTEYVNTGGHWVYTEKGAKEENARRTKQNEESLAPLLENIKRNSEGQLQAEIEAAGLLKGAGVRKKVTDEPTKTTPTKTDPKKQTVYPEGSLAKLGQDIQLKQQELSLAVSDESRAKIQKELDALLKRKEEIEAKLKPVIPEGSMQWLEKEISNREVLLKAAVDDESRAKIQAEIKELTGQKELILLKLKPVIDDKDIRELEEDLSKHHLEVQTTLKTQATEGVPKSGAEKASNAAQMLKTELEYSQSLVKSYRQQYELIQQKVKAGATLTADEQKLVSIYQDATKSVENLSSAYLDAANNADKLRTKAQLKKSIYKGITGTIDNLGNLNSSVSSVGNTWKDLAENWEDKSAFEQVTDGISAVITTIQSAIGAYESIMDTIEMFGEISAAMSAKKVAENAAETASDTTKTTIAATNTQTRIANNQAEQMSDMASVGTKEAASIASATASGASLPFPANIAAIAAGIAAVVAAFAMIASFADGGIIKGKTTNGDYNLARVNSGEMILNGSQQKRLFNLLDGNGGYSKPGSGKQKVDFRISGTALKGVLRNVDTKKSKI